jgi:hypothetical protein
MRLRLRAHPDESGHRSEVQKIRKTKFVPPKKAEIDSFGPKKFSETEGRPPHWFPANEIGASARWSQSDDQDTHRNANVNTMAHCKNALFARFLRELEDEAASKGRNASAQAFGRVRIILFVNFDGSSGLERLTLVICSNRSLKARAAMEKYPLYLLRIEDAKDVLDGLTEPVCKKLSEKLYAWTIRHPDRVRNGVVVAPAGM